MQAGIAKTDITTEKEDAVIKDRLYVKTLVLADDKTTTVIIAMDVTAIDGRDISMGLLNDVKQGFLAELRGRIESELSLPGSNVLVNASHTHPPGRLLCDDDEQIERVYNAVKSASENMTEVKVGAGIGHEDRITINRNLMLKNGKRGNIRHSNPCPSDEEVADIGPIDPQIGVLRIDRLDGKPLAAVYNFACHPLFGDAKGSITANFPAYASKVIEEGLGEGVMALFLQGAAGDVVDINFKDFDKPRHIEPLGMMLGFSTLKALRKVRTTEANLNVISENIELPRRTDFDNLINKLQADQTELLKKLRFTALNFKSFLPMFLKYTLNSKFPLDYSYKYLHDTKRGVSDHADMDNLNRKNIDKYLANIKAMEQLAQIQDDIETLQKHKQINQQPDKPTITAEVQGIKIGDCVIITSPAELLTQIGLNIKSKSPYKNTFVAAYSNGYMHYGVPTDEYDKGGYEATECLLAPEWQNIYEQKASNIIHKLNNIND